MAMPSHIEPLSAGDREYAGCLWEKYRPLIGSVASAYISDPDTRQDVIQSSMETIIKKIPKLRGFGRGALSSYISSVVRSASINALRRAGREKRLLVGGDYSYFADVPDNTEAAEERLLRFEKQKMIRSALRRLSRTDRVVLEGKYLLQLSDGELGKILNVTPAAVRMRLTRARKRARALFACEKSLTDYKTAP